MTFLNLFPSLSFIVFEIFIVVINMRSLDREITFSSSFSFLFYLSQVGIALISLFLSPSDKKNRCLVTVVYNVIKFRLWRRHGGNRLRFPDLPPQHDGGEAGFLWRLVAAAFRMAAGGGETVMAKKEN